MHDPAYPFGHGLTGALPNRTIILPGEPDGHATRYSDADWPGGRASETCGRALESRLITCNGSPEAIEKIRRGIRELASWENGDGPDRCAENATYLDLQRGLRELIDELSPQTVTQPAQAQPRASRAKQLPASLVPVVALLLARKPCFVSAYEIERVYRGASKATQIMSSLRNRYGFEVCSAPDAAARGESGADCAKGYRLDSAPEWYV